TGAVSMGGGTIVNDGSVEGGVVGGGLTLGSGGSATNGASGSITGVSEGIYLLLNSLQPGQASVVNACRIAGTGLNNAGIVLRVAAGSSSPLPASITNAVSGSITGAAAGVSDTGAGIARFGGALMNITNYGRVAASAKGVGIYLAGGGVVINEALGTIA